MRIQIRQKIWEKIPEGLICISGYGNGYEEERKRGELELDKETQLMKKLKYK